MVAVRKEIEALGWYTPAEMSSLDFCPADAELLPVVFGGAVEYETSVLMSDVQKSTTGKHEKVRKYENEV